MHQTADTFGNKEKTILINRLKQANLSLKRFLKVDETKKPIEKEWQNQLYTPDELQNIQSWGICGGNELVLIDADNKQIAQTLRNNLPASFEVLSSRRKLPHFYFKIINGEIQNKTLYLPETNQACGEIRANNQYLVAPGTTTIHGLYKINADRPIATLSYQQFMDKIKPYLGKDSSQKLTQEQIVNGVSEGQRHQIGIKLANKYAAEFSCDYETVLHEMQRWNKKCKPPNNEEEIKQIVQDAIIYIKQKTNPEQTNGETEFKQKTQKNEPDMGFALQRLNNYVFKCPIDSEELLVYNNGIYEPAKTLVHQLLETEYKECLKRHFVDEAYAHLQRANYIKRTKINQYINKIPLQNGLFNLYTRELEDFDSNQIYTYKLEVNYDPKATCPNWNKFIKQIVAEDDVALLQEIMGYCLLPAMPFHKLFWWYGKGRNGKGRVIATLEHILGQTNCCNLNLSEFKESRRFSLCQLYGKLLNVSSEPQLSKYGLQTNVLKLISGEDTIFAELKGNDKRLQFRNIAKPIILGNRFPKVEDNSLGWWDRIIVLNFPNEFVGEDNVPNIERKWLESQEEVSGILNFMLEGLYRLKENNGFSISKTAEQTKNEFMRVSEPFNAWLNDYTFFSSDGYITRQVAYDSYKDYVDELGAEPDSTKTFYAKIRQTPKIKDCKMKIKDKLERIFKGISLKDVPEEDQNQTTLDLEAHEAQEAHVHNPKNNEKISKTKNNKEFYPAFAASPASNNAESFVDGKYPTCFSCHQAICRLNQLTNIDGKPIHVSCKEQIDIQKKRS